MDGDAQGSLEVGVAGAVAAAALLAIAGAVFVVLRQRSKRRASEEAAAKAPVGASRTGPRHGPSGNLYSEPSIVQSRKVEVPDTTQVLISTVRPRGCLHLNSPSLTAI